MIRVLRCSREVRVQAARAAVAAAPNARKIWPIHGGRPLAAQAGLQTIFSATAALCGVEVVTSPAPPFQRSRVWPRATRRPATRVTRSGALVRAHRSLPTRPQQ